MELPIPFIGGASGGNSSATNPQETVNLFFEKDLSGGRNALVRLPGLLSMINVADGITTSGANNTTILGNDNTGEIRGMRVVGDYLYVVCGNCVIKLGTWFRSRLGTNIGAGASLVLFSDDLIGKINIYDRVGITQDNGSVYWARVMTEPDRYLPDGTYFQIDPGGGSETYSIDDSASQGNICYFYSVINDPVMDTSTGFVTMTDNGTFLLINDGTSKAYVYNTSTSEWAKLSESDDSFLGGGSCDSQDGYALSHRPNTNEFYFSNVNAWKTWDPLDNVDVYADTGKIVRIICDDRKPIIFKKYSTEIFFNSDDSNLTFRRTQGGNISQGCAAIGSVVKLDNTIIWLAIDRDGLLTIRDLAGNRSRIISNSQMMSRISNYSRVDDAIAFGYGDRNLSFYQITFPTDGETWIYEVSSMMWSRRTSYKYIGSTSQGRHRANCFASFNDMNLVGDFENGIIYQLKDGEYKDNDEPILWKRVVQTVSTGGKTFSIGTIELLAEMGVGVQSGQGSDPQVMMRLSKDDGKTWTNVASRSMGKIGEYDNRIRFHRNGSARNLTIEISGSDPVNIVLVGLIVNIN